MTLEVRDPPSRARLARLLLLVFIACWLVNAAGFLIPVADGAITLRGWLVGNLVAPVLPFAWIFSGDRPFTLAFMLPFALAPLVVGGLAVWRRDDPQWRWLAQGTIVLWWLVNSMLLGLGV